MRTITHSGRQEYNHEWRGSQATLARKRENLAIGMLPSLAQALPVSLTLPHFAQLLALGVR